MKKVVGLFVILAIAFSNAAIANTFAVKAGGGSLVPEVGLAATSVVLDSWANEVDVNGNIYIAEDDYMGVIPGRGVVRVNTRGLVDRMYIDPLQTTGYIDDIEVDSSGNVYYTTLAEIKVWNNNNSVNTCVAGPLNGEISSLEINEEGIAYIGTYGGSVYKADTKECVNGASANTVEIYNQPAGIDSLYADNLGNVFFYSNFNIIKKVSPQGVVTNFAGNGIRGNSGDGSSATSATIGSAYGITGDKWGNIFFTSDADSSTIRKVDVEGIISTVNSSTTQFSRLSSDGEGMLYASTSFPFNATVYKLTFAPSKISIPATVSQGQVIEVRGRYFGKSGVNANVTVGGVGAVVKSWSQDEIVCVVPNIKGNGLSLTVTTSEGLVGSAPVNVK